MSSVNDTLRILLGQLHQQNLGVKSTSTELFSEKIAEHSTLNSLNKKTMTNAKDNIENGMNAKQNLLVSPPVKTMKQRMKITKPINQFI
jgi:hypothetical protein